MTLRPSSPPPARLRRRPRRPALLPLLATTALLAMPAPGFAGADPVTARELLDHVRYLSSDELAGRGTGEPGGREAAEYVAREFERAGLEPFGDDGGWLQEFPARVATSLGPDNLLSVPKDGGRRDLERGVDFIPFSFSASGECSAPVAFAGYGITAPEFHWDDYTHLDVRGKVVLVLRYEPGRDDTASAFLGRRDTHHADLRTKARNAELHGAVGLLVVNGPLSEKGVDELVTWSSGGGTSQAVGIPTAHIRREVVEEFWGAGLSEAPAPLAELQSRLDAAGARGGAGTPVTDRPVTLRTDLVTETRTTWNVVGWLPPTSTMPATESRPTAVPHLVLGAHYDHLGLGGHSSLNPDTVAVHNGADDNASGTAALIELAEAFATGPAPRARGIVFVAFGAEELGLFGASWYVDHAPVPVESAVAMLNMDMVGRLKEGKLQVGGVGTTPAFRGIVEEAYAGSSVTPVFSEGGTGPSDHSVFNGKKRPVLFFFTGVHEDYHRPSDDWQKINAEGMEAVVVGIGKIAEALVRDAADHPYVAVASDSAAAMRGGSGYGAYLGTVPDMAAADVEGVKLSDVRPGGPAAVAGLLGGDVIVAFDGRPVRNLYDLTDELRSHRPGDTVAITVLRDGERVTRSATLGKR
jgi:aminopeptidase YwaD